MQCPKCANSTLKTAKLRQRDLELDSCPSCRGVWFDTGELDSLLGKRASPDFEIPQHAISHAGTQCPKCAAALYEFCYPGTLTLVDACKRCGGVWLDSREWKEISDELDPANRMTCPKCSATQKKAGSCASCGFVLDRQLAMKEAGYKPAESSSSGDDKTSFDESNYRRAAASFNAINQLKFVTDELENLPGIDRKPAGGVGSFLGRVGYALSLGLREKEIIVFGLLQMAAVMLAYVLWVQMLDWIPESVWRSAENSDSGSVADYLLFGWGIVCLGLAAFPIGILTGCMGATHFLHRQGEESTVARCLQLVLPQSWPLWMFHWVDGYITARQIIERLPKKDDKKSAAAKARSEAFYYAWKMGVAGILPSILTGNSLVRSGKNSVFFVKDNLAEVAKLRAGYSALCWIVGVGTYIGTILLFMTVDIVPQSEEVYAYIYEIYMWSALPILVAVSIVMLLLRPIYVIAICDLYSDHLEAQGKKAAIPEGVSRGTSALVAFAMLCIIVMAVFLFRDEMGISAMLATPYE